MGVNILSADGAVTAEVDATHKAQRASLRPAQVLSWSSIADKTGLVTVLAANATLFSLRNTGANVVLVRRVQMQWITTTTFTAAQRLEYGLYIASFSSADAGGTALNAGSGKHRTTMSTPAIEARIALTTALTAGSRTLSPSPVGIAAMFSNAVGATMQQTSLLSQDAGDHPIVLGTNEGLVLNNLVLMGAAGVGVVYLNVEFAEAASY